MNPSPSPAIKRAPLLAGGVVAIFLIVAATFSAFTTSPFIAWTGAYAGLLLLAVWSSAAGGERSPLVTLAVLFALGTVAICVWSPVPNGELEGLPQTDRLNYSYVFYLGTVLASTEENFEGGFLLLSQFASRFVSFQGFLVLIAMSVLLSMTRLMTVTGNRAVAGLLALVLLAYFTFWSGALNVTRQFLASAVGFWSVSLVMGERPAAGKLRTVAAWALALVAANLHFSGLIFILFHLVHRFRGYGQALVLALWGGALGVFALNFLGYSPLSAIPGVSDRLARYDSSRVSDAGLAQLQSSGVTSGNRLDWAVFLIAPLLFYLFSTFRQPSREGTADPRLLELALLYTVLCLPFYLLSFLTFADRIAFYGFLLLPAFALATAQRGLRVELRLLGFGLVALACTAQWIFGIYGYTPRHWFYYV